MIHKRWAAANCKSGSVKIIDRTGWFNFGSVSTHCCTVFVGPFLLINTVPRKFKLARFTFFAQLFFVLPSQSVAWRHRERLWSGPYCWFSYDVTKIQTAKLSILLRFFYGVLEQLKTNFPSNFLFKRVLGFVIEYPWIFKLLRDAAFTWRPKMLSFRIKKVTFFEKFCYLNISSVRKSITSMFMSSSRSKFTLL